MENSRNVAVRPHPQPQVSCGDDTATAVRRTGFRQKSKVFAKKKVIFTKKSKITFGYTKKTLLFSKFLNFRIFFQKLSNFGIFLKILIFKMLYTSEFSKF